jgi:putative ABC transport system permease protein
MVRLRDVVRQDLRYTLRQLRNSPGFAVVAALTLALGVGATTAIFGAVDGVLFKPLPYADADRLMTLWEYDRRAGTRDDVSTANFLDWQARTRSFAAMALVEPYSASYRDPGEPGQVILRIWRVTAEFFRLVGTRPLLGRTFLPEEFTPGRERVLVISHGFWQRRFGGDASVVGRVVDIDGRPATVVGVMPPGFRLPLEREVWAPLVIPANVGEGRGMRFLQVVARLAAGVTPERAQAELDAVAVQLRREYPVANQDMGIQLIPLRDQLVGPVRPLLLTLLGAVGFVLLIACANVANLMLARAVKREREFAVRAALGAGRVQVARQLVTESLAVAVAGGVAGVLVAVWGVGAIRALTPADLPRAEDIGISWRVLGFALGASLLTALLFGVAPATRAMGADPHDALRGGARAGTGTGRRRLRRAIVVVEISLALVLLVGAGLLVRSFVTLLDVDRGYHTDGVAAATVHIWQYPEGRRVAFAREVIERVAALPGVRSAAVTSALPLADNVGATEARFAVEGRPPARAGEEPRARASVVTPGYFATLGIPLRRGRLLAATDDSSAAPVVVVSETLARQQWPGEDPIGKRMTVDFSRVRPATREVVGVVSDVRHTGLDEPPRPALYMPHAQLRTGALIFTARTSGDPAALLPALRKAIWASDPSESIYESATLEGLLHDSLRPRRFTLVLLVAFSLTALALAAVGIYGLMSHVATERARELGVRVALGARVRDVLTLVLGEGLWLAALGVVIGLASAAALTRVLRGMLFGVEPLDAMTFVGVAALVLLFALLASLVPARRSARVEPIVALRDE